MNFQSRGNININSFVCNPSANIWSVVIVDSKWFKDSNLGKGVSDTLLFAFIFRKKIKAQPELLSAFAADFLCDYRVCVCTKIILCEGCGCPNCIADTICTQMKRTKYMRGETKTYKKSYD